MRYLVLVLTAIALAACSSSASKSSNTPTVGATTARPSATIKAQPTEKPSVTVAPATRVPERPTEVPPTVAPAPIVVQPTLAPAVASGNDYPCEAAKCTCAAFPSHAEAQRIYEKHGGNNWSGLDRDKDGIACETLP